MKKIFPALVIVLVLIGLIWGILYNFSDFDFSKFNPFKRSELDPKENELLERVKILEHKSDSLQPIISRYQKQTDSLRLKDSLVDMELNSLRQKDLLMERKLSQSKDSLNKYRNNLKNIMKTYDDIKRNPKKASNKETLDFFQKY